MSALHMSETEVKQLIVRYKMRRNLSPNLAAIYEAAERAAEEVARWPEWKRNISRR